MSIDRSPRRAAAGFTLIEVMAAVLVVGLLYTVLASSYIDAVGRVGTSHRAAHAALLADQALADLEEQMAIGVMPPLERTEEEVDDLYTLRIDVLPFDVLALVPEELIPETEGAAPSLLDPDNLEQARLRRIDVRVVWEELGEERDVSRSTLAFDTTGLSSLLPGSSAEGAAEPEAPGTSSGGEFSLDDAIRQFEQLERSQ